MSIALPDTEKLMKNTKPQHYYLFASTVVFKRKGSESLEQMGMNVTITTNKKLIIAKDIGRGQQSVQLSLHQRFPGEIEDVIDVFVMSISYLGVMTQAEFVAGLEDTVAAAGNA